MTTLAEKPKRRTPRFPEPIIERGLMAMAQCNGNAAKASRLLALDGIEVHSSTLRSWAFKTEVARYGEIRAQWLPQMRAREADKSMAIAEQAMEINVKLLDRLANEVDDLPVKELPGSSRNMAVVTGVHIEKAEALNDRPTQRVQIDLTAILKELRSMGVDPAMVIEADVVPEEAQAQLAEGKPLDKPLAAA